MRKCTLKDDQEIKLYSSGDDVMRLKNDEINIKTGKNLSFAQLKADSAHNIPNETTSQKNENGYLYYGGGSNFKCELFEVYVIQVW